MPSRVAALVLARDRAAATRRTVEAVLAQEPAFDAALLVDNAGTPELSAVLAAAAETDQRVSILKLDRNLGCAGGYEAGLRRLLERDDLDYICGFDDDGEPEPLRSLAEVHAAATRRERMTVPNLAWHGLRYRRAGLRCYLAPAASTCRYATACACGTDMTACGSGTAAACSCCCAAC